MSHVGRGALLVLALALACQSAEDGPTPRPSDKRRDQADIAAFLEPQTVPLIQTSSTWKPSTLPPGAVRLSVGEGEELPLQRVDMRIRVDGWRARVVSELVFHNRHQQRLEGTFQLRLPPGATPYYIAFGAQALSAAPIPSSSDHVDASELAAEREGWPEARHAQVVAREKAAEAYTDTVRVRRVDPALLEWAGAGVFNVRVFPIEPVRKHRIVMGYDVDLLATGETRSLAISFPAATARRLTLDADDTLGVDGIAATWKAQGERQQLRVRLGKGEPVALRFHRPARPTVLLDAGDSALATGVGPVFAARVVPPVPAGPATKRRRRAVFLLDTSASARPHFERWLALLERILARNEKSVPSFALLSFDVAMRWWKPAFARNTATQRSALLSACRRTILEGATDLRGALLAAGQRVGKDPCDVFLLSDAIPTWGRRDLAALEAALGRGTLFAYRLGAAPANVQVLSMLTGRSGGSLFTIADPNDLDAAAIAHIRQPWQIRTVGVEGGTDVLLGGNPRALYRGQVVVVAGRGEPTGPLVIELQRGGERCSLRVPLGSHLRSPLAARAYGQVAVGALELVRTARVSAMGEVVAAFARHFRIPGETASLLMLEQDQDYSRFGVLGDPKADALRVEVTSVRRLVGVATRHRARVGPRAWLTRQIPRTGADIIDQQRLFKLVRLASDAELEPAPSSEDCAVPADAAASYLAALDAITGKARQAIRAEGLRRQDQPRAALRALSSMAESEPGRAFVLRELALRAEHLGCPGTAASLWRQLVEIRPNDAQAYLALARCNIAARRGARALLWLDVVRCITSRNRPSLLHQAEHTYQSWLKGTARSRDVPPAMHYMMLRSLFLRRRRQPTLDRDLVVRVDWSTEATDVDLDVVEPIGVFRTGLTSGTLLADAGDSVGSRLFLVTLARQGTYTIRLRYSRRDPLRVSGATCARVLIRLWPRTRWERVIDKIVMLDVEGQDVDVAQVVIPRR